MDAADRSNERIRTLDLTLEINIVSWKLETQNLIAETCDLNPEILFTQIIDPKFKSKPRFRKHCS